MPYGYRRDEAFVLHLIAAGGRSYKMYVGSPVRCHRCRKLACRAQNEKRPAKSGPFQIDSS